MIPPGGCAPISPPARGPACSGASISSTAVPRGCSGPRISAAPGSFDFPFPATTRRIGVVWLVGSVGSSWNYRWVFTTQNIRLYPLSAVLQFIVPAGIMTAALQNASFWLGSCGFTASPCIMHSSWGQLCPTPQLAFRGSLGLSVPPHLAAVPPPAPYIPRALPCVSTIYRQNLFL